MLDITAEASAENKVRFKYKSFSWQNISYEMYDYFVL